MTGLACRERSGIIAGQPGWPGGSPAWGVA
jgi:hypothetical protein